VVIDPKDIELKAARSGGAGGTITYRLSHLN
jgi:protein subunit release factor B